jgi:hypothetical protein
MAKWLTAFILIVAMLGSAVAGVHARESEGKCPMSGMMDCCETAREKGNAPEVSMARLCCNLNCSEPGTTVPSSSTSFSPSPAMALHTGAVPPAAASSPYMGLPRSYSASSHQTDSNPAYIRHLALLI